ncbi:MAG: PilZ domain-containing protein [Bryobacterales bacterium]|nr:PilZ domain-containing protein [Bryobacterales bacterium]
MNDRDTKALGIDGAAALQTDDRRTEPRYNATGNVRLLVGGPQLLAVPGKILDVSEHGMRVEHMYAALASGTMLEIQTATERYTARVVWNRIRNDGVESGFYLL